MATPRSYGEACGLAHALDLVGERWALLVVRELLLGPKRFTDLRSGLEGAAATVLSQRLRELEEAGVLRRRRLPPPANATVYELTDWGRRLQGTVLALGSWGLESPRFDAAGRISVDSATLALRTYYKPQPGWAAAFELRFGNNRFAASIADGQLDIVRGEPPHPDATIDTDPKTFVGLIGEPRRVAERIRAATEDGTLALTGDEPAVERLLKAVEIAALLPTAARL